MTIAENIQELHDGGCIKQVYDACNNQSIALELIAGEKTIYTFSDGSSLSLPGIHKFLIKNYQIV